MCFTDAGTLLVSNSSNWPCSLQHWTLEGSHITSYAIRDVRCVASRGDKIAVGTWSGVHVLNLKDVSMFSSSMFPGQTDFWMANYITAVAFVDAATLAVSNNDQRTMHTRICAGWRGTIVPNTFISVASARGCFMRSACIRTGFRRSISSAHLHIQGSANKDQDDR